MQDPAAAKSVYIRRYLYIRESGEPFLSSAPTVGDGEMVQAGLLQVIDLRTMARLTSEGSWQPVIVGRLVRPSEIDYPAKEFHVAH